MSLYGVLDIAGSAMAAQSIRLNATASNLANADSITSNAADTYRARRPVFATALMEAEKSMGSVQGMGVQVKDVVESALDPIREYMPHHPLADQDGYIFRPNVNPVEEMAERVSASRAYETVVQVTDKAKQMLLQTLKLGSAG